MRPFDVETAMAALRSPYPDPEAFMNAARSGRQSREALARLWMSEGIPFAFQQCPSIYESMRSWLGARLRVQAKAISMVGSCRLGWSLSPDKVGAPISSESDLDLFVVSRELFVSVRDDFCRWAQEFNTGEVRPRNPKEEENWVDNRSRGPTILDRGFIDVKMIPTWYRYPVAQETADVMSQLVDRLKLTHAAPKPTKATVRCYADWESSINQISYNLNSVKSSYFGATPLTKS